MATNATTNLSPPISSLVKIKQTLEAHRQTKSFIQFLQNEFFNQQLSFTQDVNQLATTDSIEQFSLLDLEESGKFNILHDQSTSKKIQLAVYGPNSSGKTSFLHEFLKIGKILPVNAGPVSARIIKFSYSPRESACFKIYESLKVGITPDATHLLNLPLVELFPADKTPNWQGIREKIEIHVKRPEGLPENEFSAWLKHFIEIQIPSTTLELGIDAYDTPGFLFHDNSTLKENLHELVKLLRPTLIYMYENSSFAADANECYLALKSALNNLHCPPIFFLNTKQDISVIFTDADVPPTKWNNETFNSILPEAREKRYKLLLNVPAMKNELILDDMTGLCSNFDICVCNNPRPPMKEFSIIMRELSIQRIIQFCVKSDLEESYYISNLILSSIDSLFHFSQWVGRRGPMQWEKARQNALKWGETFFENFEKQLSTIVGSVHTNIFRHFDEQKTRIIERAVKLDRANDPLESKLTPTTKHSVKQFVEVAIQLEVITVAVNEIINQTKENLRQKVTDEIAIDSSKNELLRAAQRQVLIDISATEFEQRRFYERIIFNLSLIPIGTKRRMKGLRTLLDTDYWNKLAASAFPNKTKYYEYNDALDYHDNLTDPQKRKDFADAYMNRVKTKLNNEKHLYERNLKEWVQYKKNRFLKQVDSNYKLALKLLAVRTAAYDLGKKYTGPFAALECHLLAAIDFSKFEMQPPLIDISQKLGEGGFFEIYPAQWGDKGHMVVKKSKRQLPEYRYLPYIEAHYHRQITKLNIAHIVPLLFLFEKSCDGLNFTTSSQFEDNELYIFLPRYQQSLADYLQQNIRTLKADQVIRIALDIGNVLVKLHLNEIVHRDIKSKNILLDFTGQCYLADFGTSKETILNETIIGTPPFPPEFLAPLEFDLATRHDATLLPTYDGTAVDIFSFGILLYELLPKDRYHRPDLNDNGINLQELFKNVKPLDESSPDKYENLIKACLSATAKERPTAHKVVKELEFIQMDLERKPCVICFGQKRKYRYYPCRHKQTCENCHNRLGRNNEGKVICPLCRWPVDRWKEDDNNETYLQNMN